MTAENTNNGLPDMRAAELKETAAQPAQAPTDYRALDFESLKQKWEEAGEILHDIETEDNRGYVTDYLLSELAEIIQEMEKRFPEELKALKLSADWEGSLAYYETLDFESLRKKWQEIGDIQNKIRTGTHHHNWKVLPDCYLSELDFIIQVMEAKFPEELKALKTSADWEASPLTRAGRMYAARRGVSTKHINKGKPTK